MGETKRKNKEKFRKLDAEPSKSYDEMLEDGEISFEEYLKKFPDTKEEHEAKYGKLTGLTQFLKDLKEGRLHPPEKVRVIPIRVLSEDGLEEAPSGVCFYKGEWFKAARFNRKKIKRAFESNSPYLNYRGKAGEREAIETAKSRGLGGVFVFPNKREASLDEVGKALYRSGGTGALFSTGRLFYGAYKKREMSFSEQSFSIDLIGLTSEPLLMVAKMLAGDLGGNLLFFDGEQEGWSFVESIES